jgi:hypothetical protein
MAGGNSVIMFPDGHYREKIISPISIAVRMLY